MNKEYTFLKTKRYKSYINRNIFEPKQKEKNILDIDSYFDSDNTSKKKNKINEQFIIGKIYITFR